MQRYLEAFDTLFGHHEALQGGNCGPKDSNALLFKGSDSIPVSTSAQSRLFDEIIGIHEYERQRLGQELHDSAGQLLVALQLSIAHLREVEGDSGHDDLLEEIKETAGQIDQQIRSLAFLDYPAELGDRGLCCAVQILAVGYGRRTGLRTTFKCIGDPAAVDQSISIALLRVAQEALANIHRHAHATSAKIVLERRPNQLRLTISDDGLGIPAKAFLEARGIGLESMRHRIQAIGGRFRISRLKQGTRISASVPIAA